MKPIIVTRDVHATPERVWEVLSDGWIYPVWVVGAARIRAVDDTWPAVGARLHHSVGPWPLLLDDVTKVVENDDRRRLKLNARAWPIGSATVTISLEDLGAVCRVMITEDVASGPARLVPRFAHQPGVAWRNREALRRLAYLAEASRPQAPR